MYIIFEQSIIIIGIILAAVLFFLAIRAVSGRREDPIKRAGRLGEEYTADIIARVLRTGEQLLTNVTISYEGKRTELDSVVITRYGVYVFEVKNYAGHLVGGEDDDQWDKIKMTPGGQIFEKQVRNPIKQVNRQVYILANYLRERGIKVWVEGYVIFVQNNSPVRSPMVLTSGRKVNEVIHRQGKNHLTQQQMAQIVEVLTWQN